ncbi:dTDP-4-dehydrorhamnose 3,5-epimerase [compost metagenome]
MDIIELDISDCYLIKSKQFNDHRGSFFKTFHKETYSKFGIDFEFAEEFYSISHKNVIRGMHFQTPPVDHDKIVYCPVGAVIDVFVDIRKASKTYGKFRKIELTSENGQILFLPKGIAHGFISLADNSLMVYKTSTTHSPVNDAGIRWDSFGCDWGIESPVLSDRDQNFIKFSDFDSPFF